MKTGFISGEETTGDWPVVWSMIFIQTTLICCSLPTPLHFSYSSYSLLLFLQWNSIQHIHPAFPTSIWMSEYMMSDCQSAARLNTGCRIAWGQLAEYCIVLDCSPIKWHCWNNIMARETALPKCQPCLQTTWWYPVCTLSISLSIH